MLVHTCIYLYVQLVLLHYVRMRSSLAVNSMLKTLLAFCVCFISVYAHKDIIKFGGETLKVTGAGIQQKLPAAVVTPPPPPPPPPP